MLSEYLQLLILPIQIYMEGMCARNGVWAPAREVDLVLGDELVARGIIEVSDRGSDRASSARSCGLTEKLERSVRKS